MHRKLVEITKLWCRTESTISTLFQSQTTPYTYIIDPPTYFVCKMLYALLYTFGVFGVGKEPYLDSLTSNSTISAKCLTLTGKLVDCDQYPRLIQHGMIFNLGNIIFNTSS
jgi:hypothetical protein